MAVLGFPEENWWEILMWWIISIAANVLLYAGVGAVIKFGWRYTHQRQPGDVRK